MNNIKAVMCDIDGTLLNSNGVVSPKTIEAVKKLRKHGILFGISTGRDVPSVKHLLKKWGIEGDYEGIGHCVLGYAAAELPAAKPRKENYVYYVEA